MAQRVQVILEDDLDQSPADETVTFGLDGVTYEIDLNEANAAKLRDAFAPYVGVARRVSGRRSTGRASTGGSRSAKASELAEIRTWARANGFQVSDRGRISEEVRTAYEKANR